MSSSFVGGDEVVVRAYNDEVDTLVLAAEAAAVALVIENGDDAMDNDDDDGDEDETSPEDATTNQIHAGAMEIDRRGCATGGKCRGSGI